MARRSYFLPFIILLGCAVFMRRNDFAKGMDYYHKSDFLNASKYFDQYYQKHPASETTMYYLYDCYQKLNKTEPALAVLEQLRRLGSEDENVYLNLFYHYQKSARYQDLYHLLVELKPQLWPVVDKKYVLTRRLYAEILNGAFGDIGDRRDPIDFAIKSDFLEPLPDGRFYENDSITKGNLIIVLDKQLAPIYPSKFLSMAYISNHSFLYLPYMRLVCLGILDFDANLNPRENAPLSMATRAIANLKRR